jgi:uncharacterized lipoprotein YbaY
MKKRLWPLLFLFVGLAACTGIEGEWPEDAALVPPGELRGEIILPEGASVPADAELRLRLVNASFAYGGQALAEIRQPAESSATLPFEFPFDPEPVIDRASYTLEATIHDGDGRLIYFTRERPVVIRNGRQLAGVTVSLVTP